MLLGTVVSVCSPQRPINTSRNWL